MTLRVKASIILCLLISITLGITGYYYLVFFESSLRDSILKGLSSVGNTSSQVISRFLSDSLKEAQAIARALPREVIENQDAESAESILRDYLAIFPKFENGMFILDAKGRLWADYPAHPKIRGKSFDYRQYFKNTIIEQRGIIGIPYRSARTGKPVLTFTAVLNDKAGNIIGVLGCSVQLTSPRALEGVRLTKIGQFGYLYVYNKDRLMILHPKEERILKEDVPVGANKLFDAAIQGFEGTGETVNSRGVSMLISMKHIEGTDWILGCQQPKSEAYSPIAEARRKIIMAILLAAFSAVFIGAIIMRRITVPLIRLQEASRLIGRIAEKKKGVRFDGARFNRKLDSVPENGELGDLKHAFRAMHEKLDQAMQSLQELATDWVNTFDSVKDVVVLLDRNNRILRLNRSARHFIQKSNKEAVGLPIRECLRDLPKEFFPLADHPSSDRQANIFNIDAETVRGDLRTYEISYTPLIDKEENNVGTVLLGKDISSRLTAEADKSILEKKLRQAQQMEAIGLLAGGVAHDLNNVLSGIVSYPDLILMDLPEGSPLRKHVQTMQSSGQKAAEIVQDLLTLARRGVVNKNVLNLNDIILDYLKSPEYEKLTTYHSNVSVGTNLDKYLLNIEGSSIQLIKLVMNLLSNAAESQPTGGKITISTQNQYVDTPIKGYEVIKEGDFVVLEVKDTGLGIAAEDLTRIFEPFYTKKVMGRSGTGLGMAVVWGTIHDHNGYIDIKSTEGVGTTFCLFFPAKRDKSITQQGVIPVEEYMGRKETVLVIDDVREQRDIAANILGKLNYVVNTVSSGEDGVEYMKNNSVDLLILDMIMEPGIDGLETYRRIVKLHPNQKAIIASGYSENDRVAETQKLGAGEYLKKPYTLEKIGIAVKEKLKK